MARGSNLASLAGYASVIGGLEDVLEDWTTDEAWAVGTPAEYAIRVHEGDSGMEGRPFLTDAIDEVARTAGDDLAKRADSADELLKLIALALEGETKHKITEYGAVDTEYMRGSTAAVKIR